MAIIKFSDVWEMYRIKFIIDGKTSWENFWALKGISFEMEKGRTLGILGENGAGKSTILKLIAGILKPDRGEINVLGKVSGVLELGAGFQMELTGKDNTYLNAGLFGLTQKQIKERYADIINFANIGKFIDAPVKCYSQGMFVRLAFAIAIHVDPDILLIDDTLAVGDEYFQKKCIKKIFELKEQGKTIIFVTHDMHMLSRLCKRALFIKEGRVVKDGLIDEVIPLYTQMVGARASVGILEKNPLNLVFNSGRFFLNWQDKLLTPNSGVYTLFLIANKWYSSLQADWEVKRDGENKLIATGRFYQLALTQIWRLELTNNYEIKWDIEIDSQEPLEIQEGYVNIMLINEYARWFTTLDKGRFPSIDEKDKNWQALLEGNVSRKCIGVETQEFSGGKIPSLAFEQSCPLYRNYAQILNTDYFTNCRILQYKTFAMQNYATPFANRFIYFSGKIHLGIQDIDNYLKKIQDEFILSNGKLKLIFNNGQEILSYDNITLTKASHMGTSIFANGRWYFSNSAHWEVKKKGRNAFIAKGSWHNLPIVQIWEIELISELSFLWKINMQVKDEVNIEQQYVYFLCTQHYKYWFSEYGRGNFSKEFLEVEMDMTQRCIPDGTIGLLSQNNLFPTLSLRFSKESNNFAKIINSDFYNKARILRVERVEPERDIRFAPGEYACFKLDVALEENKQLYREDLNILQNKKLKFIFDKGSGRIYWDGIELTKRLGLYTSLRSKGRWYDSASSAIWKIKEKNKNIIKLFGKWLHLPISQYWEIKLIEDNSIEFNVSMKVERKVEVDRLQANLMLSEKYRQWIVEGKGDFFPPFKVDIDDDWESIWSGEGSFEYIGTAEDAAENDFLPSVIFSPKVTSADWFFNIVNSDIYHRGRVLQYLNNKKIQLLPAEYPYFSSKIIIKK